MLTLEIVEPTECSPLPAMSALSAMTAMFRTDRLETPRPLDFSIPVLAMQTVTVLMLPPVSALLAVSALSALTPPFP